MAALRRLDLCALLDKATAATPSFPAGARPSMRQPFECWMGDLVFVTAIGFGQRNRISSSTRTIGAALAYVHQDVGCEIALPVSFKMALQFNQVVSKDGCGELTKLVASAAKVLANPDAVRAKPAWDACSALAATLDAEADKTKLVGNTAADCTDFAAEPTPVGISFAAFPGPSAESRTAKIGGTRVSIDEDADLCDIYWRQRPFDSRYAAAPDFQVLASSQAFGTTKADCDRSTALAEKLMEVLEKPPPTDTAPQRPLLYRPDEPDSPYLGACNYVDDPDPKGCQPYVEVPVPGAPAEIPDAVTDDADVQCALSVKAVGTRFGAGLTPVADSNNGTRCFFVEPQRRLQLTFSVSYGKVTDESDGKAVTVAGHPGYLWTDPDSFRYELSTTTELRGEATMTLVVAAGPATDAGPPKDADRKAQAALTDIVRAYFS